ncbi:hypothetical protein [Vannielia litorea]|uniref:hypothetical protein n=1 Tax=Vannielia litorea TaxID=1217970 RepID=UPI001BD0A80F|nr:hypothetical protein [Vannielia litorea]
MNHKKKLVIFGAWDTSRHDDGFVILDEKWEIHPKLPRKQPGYAEARGYINLIELDGYALKTFPMGHALADPNEPGGIAKIRGFQPVLSSAQLRKEGDLWIAYRK